MLTTKTVSYYVTYNVFSRLFLIRKYAYGALISKMFSVHSCLWSCSNASTVLLFGWDRPEVVYFVLQCLSLAGVRRGGRVEQRRGKGGRSAVPRVTGMYSKHRQKNAQISPAKCGRFLVFLSFLLLNGTLERASGDTGEEGKERSEHTV